MSVKADAKRLVADLSQLVAAFKQGSVKPGDAWRQLQELTKTLQALSAAASDDDTRTYLHKANAYREAAAEKISAARAAQPEAHRQLDAVQAALDRLLAEAAACPPQESLSSLQDLTRRLQDISLAEDDEEGRDMLSRLNFYREEVAAQLVEQMAEASPRKAPPPPRPSSPRKAAPSSPRRSHQPPASTSPRLRGLFSRSTRETTEASPSDEAPLRKTQQQAAKTAFTTEEYHPEDE